ncbi:hypothetical protein MAHJHV61_14550 [Mycobacterium avium subsp. hominissuis]
MAIEIRVLDDEDDLIAAANVFRTAMVGFAPLAGLAPGQIGTLLEPGRTIGAYAGGQLVGTADAVTSRLTLPGGALVGHAAVTHIGVLPSFTRQGIATALVRHQRAGVRNRFRPLPPDRHRAVVRQRRAHHRGRGLLRAHRRGLPRVVAVPARTGSG